MKTILLSLLIAASPSLVLGQDNPELVARKERATGSQVGILVEYIELDSRIANRLVRKYAASPSAAPLREELEAMIDEGAAVLIETCYAKGQSGQRAVVESINEQIYPTEFDPPEIPQKATLTDVPIPGTAANPTAFEARSVGAMLEVQPQISEDWLSIDISIAPEFVSYLGREYTVEQYESLEAGDPRKLSSTIYLSKFYTMKCSTNLTVRDGDTMLVSVHRPHGEGDKMTMVLLRADILK